MSEISNVPATPVRNEWLDRPLAAAVNLDWEKTLYALFIIVAIVSRFAMLGDRVVSHDESLHTQFAYQYYNGDGYQYQALMHGPFLFHATAASYWLFGHNDFTARIPVALLGVLLVAAPFLLRDWLGRKGALFASFFFLISPYITYYSRYIRHDIYVITWALIVFFSSVYYLRERRDKYLWWFAAGLALMFSTKEVSYLYVAIFGSFLVVKLLAQIATQAWFREALGRLIFPLALALAGVVLLAVSYVATARFEDAGGLGTPTAILMHWGQITGAVIGAVGLFLAIRPLRDRLKAYASFDLIILYSSLLLPTITAGLTYLAGGDPQSTAKPTCAAFEPVTRVATAGDLPTYLGAFGRNFGRFFTSLDCFTGTLASPFLQNTLFLSLTLVAGVALGLWWGGRRWLVAAAVFHAIFGVLYTSLFTNIRAGWVDGMIESLGYWFAQQEVARGGQPAFYYLLVVPFYEYLPLLFALAAVGLWLKKRGLSAAGDAILLLVGTGMTFSFVNWLTNRPIGGESIGTAAIVVNGLLLVAWVAFQVWRRQAAGIPDSLLTVINVALSGLLIVRLTVWLAESGISSRTENATIVPAAIAAGLVLLLGAGYWLLLRRPQLTEGEVPLSAETGFDTVAYLIWWFALTWLVYSYAGEKMPWLSTHFVIPMAFLAGWYLNDKLKDVAWKTLIAPASLLRIGLAALFFFAAGLVLRGFLVDLDGTSTLTNLAKTGYIYGRILIVVLLGGGLAYWNYVAPHPAQRYAWLLGGLALLSILTMRATYAANFVNYDYANEFMVYAHGGAGTKEVALAQLEELSMRLYGDSGIGVGYDNDVSWPYTWYLRDYENNQYFDQNPGPNIVDNEVLIVGNDNWGKVDAIVGDRYEYTTFAYLQWPIEDYRNFSWGAFYGIPAPANPNTLSPSDREALFAQPRGLTDRSVRSAMWDIFFERDYTRYGEVFGKDMSLGQWPVRDEARIYVRKDVLAQLWDFGVSEYTYEAPVDPYGGGDVSVEASVVFGRIGTNPGELSTPRNVAVGPDGNVYIADSGNHRIQVFDSDGAFLSTFGTFGNEAGQFNEPWGLAVDDQFIYVADTWNFRLQKFTLDGTWVQTIGTGGSPAEGETGGNLYFGPRDIVLLPENRLLVSDTGNHRLQLIDRNGTFISQVGGYGFEPGKLYEPVGIAAGPDGTLYVADTWNRRVQSFTADLLPLNQFAVNGWQSESLNNKPYLAVDSLGRIYVTDPEGYRVLIFAADGRFIGRFGTFGSDLIGGVDIPNGITIDADNNVYVVDSNNGRVLKFGALPADLGTISGAEPPAELNPDAIQQSGDDLLFPPEESAPADAAYPDP